MAVLALVPRQGAVVGEAGAARGHGTLVVARLQPPAVAPHVRVQVAALHEARPAPRHGTPERPLPRVAARVRHQVRPGREAAAALVAAERLLARVHAQVRHQVRLVGEARAARRALVRPQLVVHAPVPAEGALRPEALAAVHARVPATRSGCKEERGGAGLLRKFRIKHVATGGPFPYQASSSSSGASCSANV